MPTGFWKKQLNANLKCRLLPKFQSPVQASTGSGTDTEGEHVTVPCFVKMSKMSFFLRLAFKNISSRYVQNLCFFNCWKCMNHVYVIIKKKLILDISVMRYLKCQNLKKWHFGHFDEKRSFFHFFEIGIIEICPKFMLL